MMRAGIVVVAGLLALPAMGQPKGGEEPSLYELKMGFVDQRGKKVSLDVFRGRKVILSMLYATCPGACPLLVSNIRKVDQQLPEAVRKDVRVLLVSFDPEADKPEVLAKLVRDYKLDERFLLATAQESDARELAALLDIKYRKLPEGGYNHSSVLVLLDAQGRRIARHEGLPFAHKDIAAQLAAGKK